METNNEKWLAGQLERHADGQDVELPTGLAHISDSLQQTMQATQARPGYINELSRRLHKAQAASVQRVPAQSAARGLATRLWRLLAGVAGAAAVAVLLLFAAGQFSQPALEPSIAESETALPPIVLRGEAGLFAGVEFRLHQPLPAQPETLALYRAEVAPLPQTEEAARDLALALGLAAPTIYRTDQGWLAEDEAGRRLTVDPTSARFPILFYATEEMPGGAPALDQAAAAERAVAFLEQAGLLPTAYETRARRDDTGAHRVLVQVIPALQGHPVHYGASELVMGAAGVVEARILPLRFTPSGEQLSAHSARDAFDGVLQGGATLDAVRLDPAHSAVETYYPALTDAAAGDPLRLLGFVQHLQPVDGGAPQMRFTQDAGGENAVVLVGARAKELPIGGLLEVSGALDQRMADGSWTMNVDGWQTPPIDDRHMDCQTGFLHREAGELVFLSDDGRTPYKLANPPAVAGGQRAELCAIFRDTPQPLPWLRMTVPPLDEAMPAVGGMRGPAADGEVRVENVEVTRVIVREEGDGPSAPPPGAVGLVTEGISQSDGTVITQTQPGPQANLEMTSPFEIGQEVEVSGAVGGFLYVEDEKIVPHITLAIDVDGDPTSAPLAYPLSGPWGLLMELSRHNHLHVTLRATVVPAEGEFTGPSGMALQMEGGWWRTWPEQEIKTFRGHYELATLEGREVRLLVDEATGERYVEAQPLYYARPGDPFMSNQPHAGDSMWVTAVVNLDPNATFGGLPIITVIKQQGGSNLPDSPDESMLDVTMPLRTNKPALVPLTVSNTLIIDWSVLGYVYSATPINSGSAQMLQPAWLFYGHSADDGMHFVLRTPPGDG